MELEKFIKTHMRPLSFGQSTFLNKYSGRGAPVLR
jgi:hypothetical protein